MNRPLVCLPASLLLICLAIATVARAQQGKTELQLIGVEKIWDQAPHNAFTDLIRFQNRFFCVFREAQGHVSPQGKIRIISSADGKTWESVGLLAIDGRDLRDPKITSTPDGRLMVVGYEEVREGSKPTISFRSFACFSADGRDWGEIKWVVQPNEILWRVTWFGGKAYALPFFVGPNPANRSRGTRLHAGDDGLNYQPLVELPHAEGLCEEATLRFVEDGTCYCLQRREPPSRTALLGTSKPPYSEWSWKELDRYCGGPNMIRLPGGQWIAGGRLYTPSGPKTVLYELDVAGGKLIPLVTLPSGGDTSYPGLVWHDEKLWVSYYSSHEGKTRIYLAVLRIN